MYALAGVLRSGAGRAGYHSPSVFITIAGVARRNHTRRGSLTIRDVLNERPNTALLTVDTVEPSKGDEVIVTLGTINRLTKLFAGHALTPTQIYEGKPENLAWHLACTDYTWLFNSRQVTKRYLSESATDIAIDLINTYAPTFSTAGIADGLDTLDEITFTDTNLADCLTQIARRIGGYWKVDYRDGPLVSLWVTSTMQAPVTLIAGNTARHRGLQFTEDLSGVITRVYGEGGGAGALSAVSPGETIIPVEAGEWYNTAGGTVRSGPQHITYTGRSLGGGGSLVGPGASPSAAPALALASGAGVESGSHDYAVTFVTAAGESLPGPISSITVGVEPAPSVAPTASGTQAGGSIDVGDHDYVATLVTGSGETTPSPISASTTITNTTAPSAPTLTQTGAGSYAAATWEFGVTFVTAAGETTRSPTATIVKTNTSGILFSNLAIGPAAVTARRIYINLGGTYKLLKEVAGNSATQYASDGNETVGANAPTVDTSGLLAKTISLTGIPTGSALVTSRKIYRRFNGTGTFKLVTTIANNTATTYTDTAANASLGADAPSSNTATANQVSLSSIPIGGSGVTSRKVYRTVAGGAQLKLQSTIADNTTTTATDSTADGSLGADAPSVDTSGLTQPEGQVSAGTTALIVAGTSAFSASGGWAVIGNGQQVIRYTGITSSSLTGIPASGAGAIVASIAYNSTVTAAPQLTGVPASGAGAIVYQILRGDQINIFVQRDDAAAQATLAALIGGSFDGIREDNIQDRRLSEDEIIARCDALLEKRKDARAEIRYQTQDVTTQSGAQITVAIDTPTNIFATFTIQEVTVNGIQESPSLIPKALPWYSVVASTEHFSLEDLLRRRRAA